MAGLVPATHVFSNAPPQVVDARGQARAWRRLVHYYAYSISCWTARPQRGL